MTGDLGNASSRAETVISDEEGVQALQGSIGASEAQARLATDHAALNKEEQTVVIDIQTSRQHAANARADLGLEPVPAGSFA